MFPKHNGCGKISGYFDLSLIILVPLANKQSFSLLMLTALAKYWSARGASHQPA